MDCEWCVDFAESANPALRRGPSSAAPAPELAPKRAGTHASKNAVPGNGGFL